ncbi:MAG: glycosyltransferase family 2 protein, partial [Lachnospiraceae bacterium]|nr:glycosyltransferase family 2 protein [Lachnospiraceae bacterium]
MKILSVVIPCYNSEAYMNKAINSALAGGDDVEVIIVNDGSTDRTKDIADQFEKKYPGIVKVVHKENGGHGDAVNTGLEIAKGQYFKVVDSDDWLGEEAFIKVLKVLKNSVKANAGLDML